LARLRTATAQERMAKALECLEQERRELDRLLRRAIQADAALEADSQRLTGMPGCGPILAATLLAEMPGLGTLGRRKTAGLAPAARDSGLKHGQRAIKGGRGQVRPILYMAAIASLTHKGNPFKDRYQALLGCRKPAKLALTAVMRKMLVTLDARIRNKQRWISPA
jgi:transposase